MSTVSKYSKTSRPLRETLVILGLWLAASFPMSLLAWGLAPALMRPDDPFNGLVFWWAVIGGMAWLFVLSVLVLRAEKVPSQWGALKRRLWLGPPVWRPSGKPVSLAYTLVPLFILLGLVSGEAVSQLLMTLGLGQQLDALAPAFAQIENLAIPEVRGRWDILAIALVSSLFNYFLGEELFFHGVLLPRMERAWGRWAWVGNGLLFAGYHVHKFWIFPVLIPSCMLYALAAQIFRSNRLPLLIHGFEGIILLVIVTQVILTGTA